MEGPSKRLFRSLFSPSSFVFNPAAERSPTVECSGEASNISFRTQGSYADSLAPRLFSPPQANIGLSPRKAELASPKANLDKCDPSLPLLLSKLQIPSRGLIEPGKLPVDAQLDRT